MFEKTSMFIGDDLNLLLLIGISKELLDSTTLNEQDVVVLYRQLKLPMSKIFQLPLRITCLEQLQLLTGRLELINQALNPSILSLVDNWGATASHYAAWSGHRKALEWINAHAPQLIEIKDKYGKTIAHYAAQSGNHKTIKWIKDHKPNLLEIKSNAGGTIAHSAAQFGSLKALEWIKNHASNLLKVKSNSGGTIAHFAAQSGHKETLEWIKNHAHELLGMKNDFGQTIAHFAAQSGHKETLEWIKIHLPNLFNINDNQGRTLAHFAVLSRNIETLAWVEQHMPHLLAVKSNSWQTIAHYAAWAGHKEALKWLQDHAPHLLDINDNLGRNIAHYAALSKDATLFNWTLWLIKSTWEFKVNNYPDLDIHVMSHTILEALNTNFTLIKVVLPDQIKKDINKNINLKLLRNKAINETIIKLKWIIIGHCQLNNPLSTLPLELLLEIFQKLLLVHIPQKKIEEIFDSLIIHSDPDRLRISQKTILHLIDSKLAELELSKNARFFGLADGIKTRMIALVQIKAVISKKYYSVEEMKQDFITAYRTHCDVLQQPRNKIDLFFKSPNLISMLEKIYKILKIQSYELNPLVSIPNP